MTPGRDEPPGPLAGLVVVDLSTTLPGALATVFLADAGADVVLVEAPEGNPLRADPGWPGLLRGKRSVVLDLHTDAGRAGLDELLAGADLAVATLRPAAARRLGFSPEQLRERHPRLIAALITGWGSDGPWAHYKGYEALVQAKCGVLHSKRQLTNGPDPAFVTTEYASIGAAHAAVQGLLAALLERDRTGWGQLVESNLVTGVGAHDPYNWFYELVLKRYPDAFRPVDAAFDEQGRPQAKQLYAMLVAPTADDVWLQFAQSSPRLLQAWLEELGLAEEVKQERWAEFPFLPTAQLRLEWWLRMIERVSARTRDGWDATFAANPHVFGERFRTPDQGLAHPQLRYEGRVVTVEDPELGPVRQPSTLVHAGGRPLTRIRRAPRLGEHQGQVRAAERRTSPAAAAPTEPGLPLAGVTILELGAMYAGPYGATLLAELGARVIKVEPLEGDPIRFMMAYPEAGGAKVLQGKESITVDLRTADGSEILQALVRRCDLVLQCFRAGVAARLGVDELSLKAINPDLVYLNANGYGLVGPYAAKPAYAPSIGAASGVAVTDAQLSPRPAADPADLLDLARRLYAGGTIPAVQADGLAALGVGSALLLALYARSHGHEYTDLATTMLATSTHALLGRNTGYAGRPAGRAADPQLRGTGALYRMYRAADGWVFLAAPTERDWAALTAALGTAHPGLGRPQFQTPALRTAHDAELAEALGAIFADRPKDAWEALLTAQDVGCVAVAQQPAERRMQSDEFYAAGYAVDAESPIFGPHRRLAPLVRFSSSRTQSLGGCTIGQHTDAILGSLGYSAARITELRARGVVS